MVYYVLKNETKIFVDSIHADHHHPTPSFLFFFMVYSHFLSHCPSRQTVSKDNSLFKCSFL